MPDVTALFYIAIMAFYLLHKNEEAKILVPVIGFAAKGDCCKANNGN